MIEIRFHGRGGQGTVVASKVLADALAKEGNYVQAYPEFGVERRGAPVIAFIRIDNKPIYDKSRIYARITLWSSSRRSSKPSTLPRGSRMTGSSLSTATKAGGFNLPKKFRIVTINATGIAVQHKLGRWPRRSSTRPSSEP